MDDDSLDDYAQELMEAAAKVTPDYSELDSKMKKFDSKLIEQYKTNKWVQFGQTYGVGDVLYTGNNSFTTFNNAFLKEAPLKFDTFPLQYVTGTTGQAKKTDDANGFPLPAFTKGGTKEVRIIGGPHDGKVTAVPADAEYMQWASPEYTFNSTWVALTQGHTAGLSITTKVRSLKIHKHEIDDTWYVMWGDEDQ